MSKTNRLHQSGATIGNLTGYQADRIYYLEKKSSVSRKRILTDRRYSNTGINGPGPEPGCRC